MNFYAYAITTGELERNGENTSFVILNQTCLLGNVENVKYIFLLFLTWSEIFHEPVRITGLRSFNMELMSIQNNIASELVWCRVYNLRSVGFWFEEL